MTERLQVYKCNLCGNIVSVMHAAAGELVCCGQAMNLLTENTTDAATEKHVPVVKECDGKLCVKVGEVAHPMQEDHYIEWIEIIDNGNSHVKYLKPGEKPEASFCKKSDNVIVREYCNLHGLWKK
ncbi:MAG: desulfoferrodoxin [Pseudomonadota bacterium]